MLMICAKKDIYRTPAVSEMPLLRHVLEALQRVKARLGLPLASLPAVEPVGVSARLAALRALSQQMEDAIRRAADQQTRSDYGGGSILAVQWHTTYAVGQG